MNDDAVHTVREAVAAGDYERALRLCEHVVRENPGHQEAHLLMGKLLHGLGDLPEAERFLRRCAAEHPDHGPFFGALASVCFDGLQFDGALAAAERGIRSAANAPEAYAVRSMLRERKGDMLGARRDQVRAARLDPEMFALPPLLDDATVERLVEEVLLELPDDVRNALENVVFALEDTPSVDVCRSFQPPAPPGELLGLFSGDTLADSLQFHGPPGLPPQITLFRCNLQRSAVERDQVLDELRITLLHEVGHFLGLDEDDLEARGLA